MLGEGASFREVARLLSLRFHRHLTLDTPDALEYERITDPEPEK